MDGENNDSGASQRWTCEACGCNTNAESDQTCSICGTSNGACCCRDSVPLVPPRRISTTDMESWVLLRSCPTKINSFLLFSYASYPPIFSFGAMVVHSMIFCLLSVGFDIDSYCWKGSIIVDVRVAPSRGRENKLSLQFSMGARPFTYGEWQFRRTLLIIPMSHS